MKPKAGQAHGLFDAMPEVRRPTTVATDTHVRTKCDDCKGRGTIRVKDVHHHTVIDQPCAHCGGLGYIMTRVSPDG